MGTSKACSSSPFLFVASPRAKGGRLPAQKKKKLTAPWGLLKRPPALVLIGPFAASRRSSEGVPCSRRRMAASGSYLDLFVLFSRGAFFYVYFCALFWVGFFVLLGFARRGSNSCGVGVALVGLLRGALGRGTCTPARRTAHLRLSVGSPRAKGGDRLSTS